MKKPAAILNPRGVDRALIALVAVSALVHLLAIAVTGWWSGFDLRPKPLAGGYAVALVPGEPGAIGALRPGVRGVGSTGGAPRPPEKPPPPRAADENKAEPEPARTPPTRKSESARATPAPPARKPPRRSPDVILPGEATPSPRPTARPTPRATASPTPTPTRTPRPTAAPTPRAKSAPTASLAPQPTAKPAPTAPPAPRPTAKPVRKPAALATARPRPGASPAARPTPKSTDAAAARGGPAPAPTATARASGLEGVRQRQMDAAMERVRSQLGGPDGAAGGSPARPGAATSAGAGGGGVAGGIGTGPGAGGGGTGPGGAGQLRSAEFVAYYDGMIGRIRSAWVWTGRAANLEVTVRFSIHPDGRIGGVRIGHASGDASYDASVLSALTGVGQLPPPPLRHVNEFADVELTFRPADLGGAAP